MSDIFDKNSPDEGTSAKIKIVSYYMGLYFNIICPFRHNSKYNNQIVYIDLFAGQGKFRDGTKSVPLKLFEIVDEKKVDNIKFYFNDINHIDILKKNIENDEIASKYMEDITFDNKDAKDIDVKSLISKNDIVLSYIDPSGYLRVDPQTINDLTSNYFSDCLFFLNINNFFLRIDVDKERNNMIRLFGNEEKLDEMIELVKDKSKNRTEREKILVKEVLTSIACGSEKKLYFLPFFIRYSDDNTKIFNSVYLVSKKLDALIKLKNSFKIKDFIKNEDGRFIGSLSNSSQQIDLVGQIFDNNIVLDFIPMDRYIKRDDLLELIDCDYMNEYGHISAYNRSDLNRILDGLRKNGMILLEKPFNGKRECKFGNRLFRRKKVK